MLLWLHSDAPICERKRNSSVRPNPNPCTISNIKFAIYVHTVHSILWMTPYLLSIHSFVHSYRSNYEHINFSLNALAFKAINGICAIISGRWSASERLDPVLTNKTTSNWSLSNCLIINKLEPITKIKCFKWTESHHAILQHNKHYQLTLRMC